MSDYQKLTVWINKKSTSQISLRSALWVLFKLELRSIWQPQRHTLRRNTSWNRCQIDVKQGMTQFFTFIAFFRLTFQRDIFNKLLVNRLHRGDLTRPFYIGLYIPLKAVTIAFFLSQGVMYLYINYYISTRIWCQYWCQWCQMLSRHQIFQKYSVRSVLSIPFVLPHRFPLSFWCPCDPWLPESL